MNAHTKRLGILGCKHTTRDLIAALRRAGFAIAHVVTLDSAQATAQQVAGYYDLRPWLDAEQIPYTVVRQYTLKNDEDRQDLLALNLDALLVMGWQRLVPDWWLEALAVGAFGMHGSNKPLPHGRGRSPLNWSLIQDKRLFFTTLFRYAPGVDDGPLVGTQLFDITPFDTAHTLHFKNLLAMIKLCETHLPALLAGTASLTPQPTEGASYYPKRTAEDGLIHWSGATWEIYNLVRAVTHPFHGAFCFLDDDPEQKILIWRAIPFDTHLAWPAAQPGEIVQVFYDGSFVVRTGDTTLLVLESEGRAFSENDIGRRLGHLGRPRKEWANLPQ